MNGSSKTSNRNHPKSFLCTLSIFLAANETINNRIAAKSILKKTRAMGGKFCFKRELVQIKENPQKITADIMEPYTITASPLFFIYKF